MKWVECEMKEAIILAFGKAMLEKSVIHTARYEFKPWGYRNVVYLGTSEADSD